MKGWPRPRLEQALSWKLDFFSRPRSGNRAGHGARCLQPVQSVLRSGGARGYGKYLVGFFYPLSPPKAEPPPRRKTLAGQGNPLQPWKRRAASLAKSRGTGRLLALGAPSAHVCSQRVPLPETWGKKIKNPADAGRTSPWLCRVPLPRRRMGTHKAKTSGDFFCGVKDAPAARDVPARAWCAGTEDTSPVQRHFSLTAEPVPKPHLTLSLLRRRRAAPVGAVRIHGSGWHIRTGLRLGCSVSDSLGAFP